VTDELPDNVDLRWLGRTLLDMRKEIDAIRADVRSLRTDMDILIRSVIRLDNTVNALREDVRDLWLGQRDLRRRIETLEENRP
jgi:hypothetical protein